MDDDCEWVLNTPHACCGTCGRELLNLNQQCDHDAHARLYALEARVAELIEIVTELGKKGTSSQP